MGAVITGFLIIGMQFISFGQQDEKAKSILDDMFKKYKETPAYNVKYTVEINSPAKKINQRGEITVKNQMYHLLTEYQEIYENENTLWIYNKSDNKVNILSIKPEDRDEPLLVELPDIYKKSYKYTFLEEIKIDGIAYEVVELNTDDKDLSYFKIILTIEKTAKTLRSGSLFEKTGINSIFTFKDFTPLSNLSDKAFVFDIDKYPMVEIYDERQ